MASTDEASDHEAGGWHRSDTIALVSLVVSILAATVSILIYLWERETQLKLRSNEAASEFLSLRHQEEILRSERAVNTYFLGKQEALLDAYAGEDVEVSVPRDVQQDMRVLLDFWNSTLKCRDVGSCDPVLIDIWFRDDICGFLGSARLVGLPQLEKSYGPDIAARAISYCGEEAGGTQP